MKKLIILLITVGLSWTVSAQQLPQLTQYMITNYTINPAVAGMQDYYQVNTTVRNMWGDIGPKTTILSIYGKKGENIGLGGMVYNDEVHGSSKIGGNISYAHHFSLSSNIKTSLALSAGFVQYKLIVSQLEYANQNDPLFLGGDVVRTIPDAVFGINTYGENWYIGLSIPQLLSTNVDFIDEDFYVNYNKEGEGQLNRHYYILGAYNHVLNPFWSIEPSLLFKNATTDTQFDFGVKATWDDKLWFGTGYRSNGQMTALAGYSIQDRYIIGYSLDMGGAAGSAFGPTHEFVLGIKFRSLKEKEILKEKE